MKKVIYLLLFILTFPVFLAAQEMNMRVKDPESGKDIIIGPCNREGLEVGKFGELFEEYYSLYEPKKEVIGKLRAHKEGLEIRIVLGIWCSDSHEQVPKFFKVLDKIKFNEENLEIICVDRDKTGGDLDISAYGIVFVPTFIFSRHGKELGRIVETPVRTLEEDMLGIVGE